MTGLLRASSGKRIILTGNANFQDIIFLLQIFVLNLPMKIRLLRRDGPTIKIHWITNIYFIFIKEGNQSLTVNFLKLDAEFTPRLKSFRMPGFRMPETNVK